MPINVTVTNSGKITLEEIIIKILVFILAALRLSSKVGISKQTCRLEIRNWLERKQIEAWKSTSALKPKPLETIHKGTKEGKIKRNPALREENSQSNSGDYNGTLSSTEPSSDIRKSIRTRLQKVRYGRGNSTPHSVRMPCTQIH